MGRPSIRAPIVVGVDGSHAAQLALRWALAEAALLDCAVQVVHAWSVGSVRDFIWATRRSLRADSQSLLRAALADARSHTDARVPVVCHSVEGHPAVVLTAAAHDAALLVLGTHHGRRTTSGLLGSVGSFCLRHLKIPVVVIPEAEQAGGRMPANLMGTAR